ncbi:hypothetical protein Leryth_000854 [Lithospermum erythrorhizon]|nr:hypothetical protein Leryth_000854 [Lithospermum erythrorhizon]
MNDVYKQRKLSAIRDFPLGLKQFPDLVDLESNRGQACRSTDEHLKAIGLHDMSKDDARYTKRHRFVDTEEEDMLQLGIKQPHGFANKVICDNPKGCKRFPEDLDPKTMDDDESCGSKNERKLKQHQRMFPKRRKVPAIRDFPPALVRVMPFIHRHTKTPDNMTNNSRFIEHDGYREPHNVGDEHVDPDIENGEDIDILEFDGFFLSNEKEMDESSFNSTIELLTGKAASTNHLEVVKHKASDIVRYSDGATTRQESKSEINIVEEIDGHCCVPDDDMFHLASTYVADFFSDNCHNGFLFEDNVEPLETISQSRQDVSQEVIEAIHESGIMDHLITPICVANYFDDTCHSTKGSGDDQIPQLNNIRRNQKDDFSSLFIPPKPSSCKNAHGFPQDKFSKENPSKYRTGAVQTKEVQREVIKLEGGRKRVGKVKYMPEEEGCKALRKVNLSVM